MEVRPEQVDERGDVWFPGQASKVSSVDRAELPHILEHSFLTSFPETFRESSHPATFLQ